MSDYSLIELTKERWCKAGLFTLFCAMAHLHILKKAKAHPLYKSLQFK